MSRSSVAPAAAAVPQWPETAAQRDGAPYRGKGSRIPIWSRARYETECQFIISEDGEEFARPPAWPYYYNWERGHNALHGRPPIRCLAAPNNLVAVHS